MTVFYVCFFLLWEKTTSSAGVLGETAKPEQYYDCSPKKATDITSNKCLQKMPYDVASTNGVIWLPKNFKMVMEYKPNITYISMAYNFIRLVDGCVLNILTS